MGQLAFVNREREWKLLDEARRKGGLLVMFGRRRIGKTRLLCRWLEANGGWYSQAIEMGSMEQVRQTYRDLQAVLDVKVEPASWEDFFQLLAAQKGPWVLCLDEFPYLTASDASLPSRLQKWLDHEQPPGCLLILAGSSRRMMHQLFLHRAAPLYGRAQRLLQIGPMDYGAFCDAVGLPMADPQSFEQFACVGGVPKYWEFCEGNRSVMELVERLYFDFAPYMEQEPQRLLSDEAISGQNTLSVLEAIGRGAERPSEIARRLGVPQTNLGRLFEQLLDASLVTRELPFGESLRSTKRVLYRIADPALRFWFRVYSPHRTLWRQYAESHRRELIHQHAATVFEDYCRDAVSGASRYWENDLEIDFVAPVAADSQALQVVEVKWRQLTTVQRSQIERELREKWQRSALAGKYPHPVFRIIDARALGPDQ